MRKNPEEVGLLIRNVVAEMMDRVMNRVLYTNPFVVEKFRFEKPLYALLVPNEIFKGAHFERRFVTPFGNIWEKLAKIAAEAATGYEVKGLIGQERLRRITEILNRLEHHEKGRQRTKADWNKELQYVLAGAGEPIPVTVICDVFIKDVQNSAQLAFELKSPLPNSDITKVSKEKIFKLYAMNPPQISQAFFALPYNPYGKREQYEWSFPARWFDMKHDEVVLIGDEFWDMIGGKGTYQFFIQQLHEIGQDYRERIYREYLGIEPPAE